MMAKDEKSKDEMKVNAVHDHEHENGDEGEEVERIFIKDEDGQSHEFEVIMYLEPDGSKHKYVLLLPVDGEEGEDYEEEVVAFRYTEEGDELQLSPLESDEEWQLVEETFLALYGDDEDEDADTDDGGRDG